MFEEFCEEQNIKQAFNVCFQIFPRLNGDNFLSLCFNANRRRIWRFAGIEQWVVPYLLATLGDIPVSYMKKIKSEDKVEEKRVSYTLRATLHKPRGHSIDILWEQPEACTLKIRFVNSNGTLGKTMYHSPIVIPDQRIEARREDTGWMSQPLVNKLNRCCDEHRHNENIELH